MYVIVYDEEEAGLQCLTFARVRLKGQEGPSAELFGIVLNNFLVAVELLLKLIEFLD